MHRGYLPLLFLLLFSSCLKQGEVKIDDLSTLKARVFKITNQNGRLLIEGQGLSATQQIKLQGQSQNLDLIIESKSDTSILAAASQAFSVSVSALYELVLSNAYGQSTFQLSFEIQDGQVTTTKIADGAITSAKLAAMGALSGQILKYNGTNWTPADLNSLVYAGTWDASTMTAPSANPMGGDFWIVNSDGDVDLGDGNGVRQWRVGDWIVYNSFTAQWDQVISSQSVVSFNGRAGEVTAQANDYTWQQIDKTLSPIDDLSDVDTSTVVPTSGDILLWNGTHWVPGVDNDSGGDITAVNAGTGLLGGATSGDATLSVDVGSGPNQIAQLDASGLLLDGIIPGLDTSKITSGVMSTSRLPFASAMNDGIISSADYQSFSGTDTTLSSGAAGEYLDGDGNWYALNTGAVSEGSNLYFTDSRARTAAVEDQIIDGVLNIAPSQNAVFDALATKADSSNLSNYVEISGSDMTGTLGMNAQNQLQFRDADSSNYVALRAPASVAADLVFNLPATDGSAGQILSTDGAGNLAWASSGDGSVTDVTATAPLASSGGTTPNLTITQASSTTNGFLSSTDWSTFNNKEPAVAAGTTAQYRRGDKTWQTLNTAAVPESGNLYYTTARARADTVADAIGDGVLNVAPSQNAVFDALATKADATDLGNYVLKAGDTMTGALNLPTDGLAVGTNQLVTSGGNVGVGTAAPSAPLHVSNPSTLAQSITGYFLQNAIPDGSSTFLKLGKQATNNNLADISYNHIADGSTENKLNFGFHGSSPYLTVKADGAVGINTNQPVSTLQVNGNTRLGLINPSSGVNTAGPGALLYFSGGPGQDIRDSDNSDPIWMSRYNLTNDSSELRTSIGDNNSAIDAFVIGYTNGGTWSPVMRVQMDTRVGIGTSAPASTLHVAGIITEDSDERLKRDIEVINTDIEKISKIKGVRYKWIDQEKYGEKEQIGVLAQDVREVFPEAVRESEDGYLSVAYGHLIGPVIEALKDFYKKFQVEKDSNNREIASLKKRNLEQDKEILALKEEIQNLKDAIKSKPSSQD